MPWHHRSWLGSRTAWAAAPADPGEPRASRLPVCRSRSGMTCGGTWRYHRSRIMIRGVWCNTWPDYPARADHGNVRSRACGRRRCEGNCDSAANSAEAVAGGLLDATAVTSAILTRVTCEAVLAAEVQRKARCRQSSGPALCSNAMYTNSSHCSCSCSRGSHDGMSCQWHGCTCGAGCQLRDNGSQ